MDREEIGKRLRDARQACGLTQEEVVKALGLVRSTLVRWEGGDRKPKDSDLRTLADIYQVTMKWILQGGEGEDPLRKPDRILAAKRKLLRLQGFVSTDTGHMRELMLGPFGFLPSDKFEPGFVSDGEHSTAADQLPGEDLRSYLGAVAARTMWLLKSRPLLPELPGIHPEVVRAMQEGTVIPSPEMMLGLAEKTLVHPSWILRGDESWAFGRQAKRNLPSTPGGKPGGFE